MKARGCSLISDLYTVSAWLGKIKVLTCRNIRLLNLDLRSKPVEYAKYMRLRWSRGSVLAFGTPSSWVPTDGRSRRIFQDEKKSSGRLPSEGK